MVHRMYVHLVCKVITTIIGDEYEIQKMYVHLVCKVITTTP